MHFYVMSNWEMGNSSQCTDQQRSYNAENGICLQNYYVQLFYFHTG